MMQTYLFVMVSLAGFSIAGGCFAFMVRHS